MELCGGPVHAVLIQGILTAVVHHILQPAETSLLQALKTFIQQVHSCTNASFFKTHCWQFLCFIVVCTTLCEQHTYSSRGIKHRDIARKSLKPINKRVDDIIRQQTHVFDLFDTIELYELLKMQMECIYSWKQDMQYIYQLGSIATYIGRGAMHRTSSPTPGGALRFREHWKLWFPSANINMKVLDSSHYRYRTLRKHNGHNIRFVFITCVSEPTASAVEMAYIHHCRPEANTLSSPVVQGAHRGGLSTPKHRGRLHSWQKLRAHANHSGASNRATVGSSVSSFSLLRAISHGKSSEPTVPQTRTPSPLYEQGRGIGSGRGNSSNGGDASQHLKLARSCA